MNYCIAQLLTPHKYSEAQSRHIQNRLKVETELQSKKLIYSPVHNRLSLRHKDASSFTAVKIRKKSNPMPETRVAKSVFGNDLELG